LAGADRAGVFLECLLGEAVEGECDDGAFEVRGGYAPGAVGAAPTGEVVRFDPDQAFIHTAAFCVAFGIRTRARRVEHITASSAEGELLPAVEYFPRILNWGKYLTGFVQTEPQQPLILWE
jgi:hypothetical protein